MCCASLERRNRYDDRNRNREVVQRRQGLRLHHARSGGKDLFAHFSEIKGSGFKTLAENQRVEFEVTQGQKGLQASNIRPVA